MRILIIIHQFFPEYASGTERVALNIARMAQRAGHYVHVLACAVDPLKTKAVITDIPIKGALRTVYQGLPVTFIPRSLLPATADISLDVDEEMVSNLALWMRQERFEVAHVMHSMRMGSAILAAQRCKLPYVLTLTDFFLPCARVNLVNLKHKSCMGPDEGHRCMQSCSAAPWTNHSYLSRFKQTQSILQAAGARVAPSEYVAERYREIFNDTEIQVIPHGVDMLTLGIATKSIPRIPQSKAQLEIVFIGTIIPQKGLDILLKALAHLPAASLRLKVIGGFHGNSAYHDEIKTLSFNDQRIEYTGSLEASDVFKSLGQADLLCLPSRVPESFSLVLHESAVAGVPALVSNLGAPARQIMDYDCGQVVKTGDSHAWAAAISALLDTPETLKRWRKNLFLPLRIEEEAFFYGSIYRRLCT